MAVEITYFVHGTTTDNENGIATGWNPGKLSELGKEQSVKLKSLLKGKKFDVVFCSDLKRSIDSATLTFGDKISLVIDERLRECNYGQMNGADSKEVYAMKLACIDKKFPGGESYRDVEKRMRDFLKDLKKNYNGKKIAIVCHQAPQLALEVIVNGKTWRQAFEEDWREKGKWQPGWTYLVK